MDERLRPSGVCIYCGAPSNTSEHVPSKIFIDEPYPAEYPIVAACKKCNSNFSLDEEYVACFLECVLCGNTNPLDISRSKIKKSLEKKPSLQKRIAKSQYKDNEGNLFWNPDFGRFNKILKKLAQGHLAYELFPIFDEPDEIAFVPISALTSEQRHIFNSANPGSYQLLSEFGSRAFLRDIGDRADSFKRIDGWIIVQPDRYRYSVIDNVEIEVRIVLSEYLFCQISWS